MPMAMPMTRAAHAPDAAISMHGAMVVGSPMDAWAMAGAHRAAVAAATSPLAPATSYTFPGLGPTSSVAALPMETPTLTPAAFHPAHAPFTAAAPGAANLMAGSEASALQHGAGQGSVAALGIGSRSTAPPAVLAASVLSPQQAQALQETQSEQPRVQPQPSMVNAVAGAQKRTQSTPITGHQQLAAGSPGSGIAQRLQRRHGSQERLYAPKATPLSKELAVHRCVATRLARCQSVVCRGSNTAMQQ